MVAKALQHPYYLPMTQIECEHMVNAAGLYADKVRLLGCHRLVGSRAIAPLLRRLRKTWGIANPWPFCHSKGCICTAICPSSAWCVECSHSTASSACNLNAPQVYPVPDLRYPFLGVHFTVTYDGKAKIGPTAIPAFWREHYKGLDNFSLKEMIEIMLR